MTSSTYDIGDELRLSVVLTDLNGAAADPTAVTCVARLPDNTTSSLSVVKDSTGHYHADIVLSPSGAWAYRWESDAPYAGAVEGRIDVIKAMVT